MVRIQPHVALDGLGRPGQVTAGHPDHFCQTNPRLWLLRPVSAISEEIFCETNPRTALAGRATQGPPEEARTDVNARASARVPADPPQLHESSYSPPRPTNRSSAISAAAPAPTSTARRSPKRNYTPATLFGSA